MTTVIDVSFAVHVQVSADGDELAKQAAQLATEGLIAPSIFWLEAASALRSLMLRGVLDHRGRSRALQGLRTLRITLDAATRDIEPVVSVSDRHQLTIYDAAYLELALRSGSGLATRDKGLAAAAARAGVELVTP